MHLVSNVVDEEEQAALLGGCGGVILTRASGGIIAGCQGVVFKNQVPLHHVAVLESRMMMGRIMRARHHPDQRCKFSANWIFVKPRYGHASERRRLPVHFLAADQSQDAA